jgi:hypothetical protein
MKRRRWLALPLVMSTSYAALVACSAPSKGALVLAVSTDMQTPKDISVVSIFITTDSVVKFDYLGRVLPDGTVSLPATLSIVEPDTQGAPVRIRVIAFQEQKARVLRDVLTTVPHERTALLRVPLNFLDDGSGQGSLDPTLVPSAANGVPDGQTTFDPDTVASKCDFSQEQTSVDGVCVDAHVDSTALPDYADTEVYGTGGSEGSSGCFDVTTCFAPAQPVTGLDKGSCSFPLPAGANAADLNIAIVTGSTGDCLQSGRCYVPLENDPAEGWSVSGSTVELVTPICSLLAAGAQLFVSENACPAKVESTPVCEPTGAGASDGGANACEGPITFYCPNAGACTGPGCSANDCSSGGVVVLDVYGNSATLYGANGNNCEAGAGNGGGGGGGGSGSGGCGYNGSFPGTVDQATCTSTFGNLAQGCNNSPISITADVSTRSVTLSGDISGSVNNDGSVTCSGTETCVFSGCTVSYGGTGSDAGGGADGSVGVDAGRDAAADAPQAADTGVACLPGNSSGGPCSGDGGASSSCTFSEDCGGIVYEVSCDCTGTCSCITNGTGTSQFSSTTECSSASPFTPCGYPGGPGG